MGYKPWGEARYSSGPVSIDYKYTGQLSLDIGTYHYGARAYDPLTGRFLSADTIVPQPGNPLAWDRYAYGLNSPIRYVDPSGHSPCDGPNGGDPDCPANEDINRWNPSSSTSSTGSPSTTDNENETSISSNTELTIEIDRSLYIPPESMNTIDIYGDYLNDPTFIDYLQWGGVPPSKLAVIPQVLDLLRRFYWYNPPQSKANIPNVFWKFTATYTKSGSIYLSDITIKSYRPNAILGSITYQSGKNDPKSFDYGYIIDSGFGAKFTVKNSDAPSVFSSSSPLIISLNMAYYRRDVLLSKNDPVKLPSR